MRNDFKILKKLLKILTVVEIPRMAFQLGECGLEVSGHGWSQNSRLSSRSSFSQETGAIGQQQPRIGESGPKLKQESSVQDARDTLTPLPLFALVSTQYNV